MTEGEGGLTFAPCISGPYSFEELDVFTKKIVYKVTCMCNKAKKIGSSGSVWRHDGIGGGGGFGVVWRGL